MKKKVMVYDNQVGYYNLLNDTVKNGYEFLLFTNGNNYEDGYDAVVFFLHDEIELIDLVKLYRPETPFVLGSSKRSSYMASRGNVFTVDLGQTKDGIEKNLIEVFETI